jgi:TNF receptor-associated protein 1
MCDSGTGDYEVTDAENVPRGSTIVIKLRSDCDEFADAEHVRRVIKKYSNFVNFPIHVRWY